MKPRRFLLPVLPLPLAHSCRIPHLLRVPGHSHLSGAPEVFGAHLSEELFVLGSQACAVGSKGGHIYIISQPEGCSFYSGPEVDRILGPEAVSRPPGRVVAFCGVE